MRIVVTGASSGIGAALSVALAAGEDELFVCGRRGQRLQQLGAQSGRVQHHVCDVSDEADVQRFVEWIRGCTPQVDALVNCAGGFGAIGRVWETEPREWTRTVATNLVGTYLMIRAVLPLMEDAPRARIVNFAGGGAFSPFPHYSAYAVSKAAIVRLTETLAVELAPRHIAVNAVAPGFVATEIHDATLQAGARAGEGHLARTKQLLTAKSVPMDVPVRCVRFLLSPASDGLTGKTISASFDPWDTPTFQEHIGAINESELYTQRRINLEHLADGELKAALVAASSKRRAGGG